MSAKRRADKELTRENWDDEDEPEERGMFQKASEDILKNRIIKTARRRVTNGASDGEHKSIFQGFTGFTSNETESQKPSFSFVSNLKEGDVTSVLDSKEKFATCLSDVPISKIENSRKPSFSFFSDESSIPVKPIELKSLSFSANCDKSASKPTTVTKFEISTNNDNENKLSTLSNKLKTVSEEQVISSIQSKTDEAEKTPDEIFLQKLRSLNLLCTEWIIKHLNENLSYILTPIFDDYKKHLTHLREERQCTNIANKKLKIESIETKPSNETAKPQSLLKSDLKENSTESNSETNPLLGDNDKNKLSTIKFTSPPTKKEETGFKFSIFGKEDTGSSKIFSTPDVKNDEGFKFGNTNREEIKLINNRNPEPLPPSSFFSFKTPSGSSMASSFFSQSTVPKTIQENVENEDDSPPPVEDVTIKEEGSVYDKKCKVFIKKDGNFVDHGVGFLFLKPVGDENKCQIIVRANNKLANVIINVLLTSCTPLQKMGKNNVMIICCPTPESKQPTSVLLKVKTADDAEELLNNLNKYHK